jgi:hypothetical protein
MLAAIVGAGIITRHAFGGTSMTQSASISAGFLLLICMAQGYVNIKRKMIQEQCEWMPARKRSIWIHLHNETNASHYHRHHKQPELIRIRSFL